MNRHEHHRHRDRQPPRPAPKKGGGKMVFWLFLGLGIAFVVSFRYSGSPSAQPPRPTKPLATLKPKDLQEQVAEQGILGGAKAGKDAVALARRNADRQVALVTEHDPTPHEMTVEKTDRGYRVIGARSEKFYSPRDEAEAKADARRVAQDRLAEELGGLRPAVEELEVRVERPSADVLKLWQENKLDTDKVWVVVDVQTSEEAIRAERSKARFGRLGLWAVAGFLVLLTGYGFLRLDMWTRGYLTTTLGVIAAAVLAFAIIFLVRSAG